MEKNGTSALAMLAAFCISDSTGEGKREKTVFFLLNIRNASSYANFEQLPFTNFGRRGGFLLAARELVDFPLIEYATQGFVQMHNPNKWDE